MSCSSSFSSGLSTVESASLRSRRCSLSGITLWRTASPALSAYCSSSRPHTLCTVPMRACPTRSASRVRPAPISRLVTRLVSSAAARRVKVVSRIASGRTSPLATARLISSARR